MMDIDWTSTTNYGDGVGGPGRVLKRRYVIMHGSGKNPTATATAEIKYLKRANIGVSYHVYITKSGNAVQLVPFDARAWHAGSSRWAGHKDLNDMSIGVAFESSNGYNEIYPEPQWDAAIEIVTKLLKQYNLTHDDVLTHKEISDPPGRKIDPVNFNITKFRATLSTVTATSQAPTQNLYRSVPLYAEDNTPLGVVSVHQQMKKAYLPEALRRKLKG